MRKSEIEPLLKSKTVWKPGSPMVIESVSPTSAFAVIFEDDGETGYLYAIDRSDDPPLSGIAKAPGNRTYPIVDMLHIYDAEEGTTKSLVAEVKWSRDGKKAGLWFGKDPQAIFDFESKRGTCRTGFPPLADHPKHWRAPHDWDEACLKHFL